MAYASSITSYPDITAALDRALASAKGVRVQLESAKAVATFCGRVHSFRFKDRKANTKIYPAGHSMHGCSAYDPLMVRKVEGFVVEIIKLDGVEFSIEDLT